MGDCAHSPGGGRCAACGAARMDEARAATGDLTYDLKVVEIDGVRNVPTTWTARLVSRG